MISFSISFNYPSSQIHVGDVFCFILSTLLPNSKLLVTPLDSISSLYVRLSNIKLFKYWKLK